MTNYAWNHLLMILIDNCISHYLAWNEISSSSTTHNFNEITYLNWKKTKLAAKCYHFPAILVCELSEPAILYLSFKDIFYQYYTLLQVT